MIQILSTKTLLNNQKQALVNANNQVTDEVGNSLLFSTTESILTL